MPQQQRDLLSYALDATVSHLHLVAYDPHGADTVQHEQAHQYATYLVNVLI